MLHDNNNNNNDNEDNESDNEQEKHLPIRKSRSRNLKLQKNDNNVPDNAIIGEVSSVIGNKIIVEVNENDLVRKLDCVPAGTIIYKNNYSNLLATGDIVYVLENANTLSQNTLSQIIKIGDRKSKISRLDPSNRNKEQIIAANIDLLIVFVSAFDPMINMRLIDRYLVAAKVNDVEPIICVNKMDLASKKDLQDILSYYKMLKIPIFYLSVLKDIGLKKLKKFISVRKSVISGPSGAGKSTFMNKILGYEAQVVREISERTSKGIHTTSYSCRYRLPEGGTIIDTPGIREFGIWDLAKFELGVLFPGFSEFYSQCKFTSCTHTHEPDCAIIKAVESGKINEEQYLSYLNIYETLED